MTKRQVVIFSTNKWFSAVNEYAWQMAQTLRQSEKWEVSLWCQSGSPLVAKSIASKLNAVQFKRVSLLNILQRLLATKPTLLYVFEGHEHTICCLFKFIFARQLRNTQIVRIRGQDRAVKNTFLNRILDTQLTDKVICPAQMVLDRIPYAHGNSQFLVFPLCMDNDRFLTPKTSAQTATQLTQSQITLSIVARFDPIKGHQLLFQALQILLKKSIITKQIVLFVIGRSENISLVELGEILNHHVAGEFVKTVNSPQATFLSKQKVQQVPSLIVNFFDHKIPNLEDFHAQTDLGLIPSLGSEVICRVALEFFAAGVPVLSSKAGALAEIVTSHVGFNFETGDVNSLQSHLLEVLLHIQNGDTSILNMKKTCRNTFLETYNAERFIKLSESIVAEKSN